MSRTLIIFDFNRTLFDNDNERLFDESLEILEYFFEKDFELILLGKGDLKRREKVRLLDIEKYFSEIHIVEDKSLSQLEEIKEKRKGVSVYSVGDRIKKEIKLGNKIDFTTIWLKKGKFSSEISNSPEETPSYTISSLLELKNIIRFKIT